MAVAIPVTLGMVKTEQDNRQEAAQPGYRAGTAAEISACKTGCNNQYEAGSNMRTWCRQSCDGLEVPITNGADSCTACTNGETVSVCTKANGDQYEQSCPTTENTSQTCGAGGYTNNSHTKRSQSVSGYTHVSCSNGSVCNGGPNEQGAYWCVTETSSKKSIGVACERDADCSNNRCGANGKCVECKSDGACLAYEHCTYYNETPNFTCKLDPGACKTKDDCASGQVCNSSNLCVAGTSSSTPTCGDNVCNGTENYVSCSRDCDAPSSDGGGQSDGSNPRGGSDRGKDRTCTTCTGGITGTVKDQDGNTVPGARVVAQLAGGLITSGQATTASNGSYTISNLPTQWLVGGVAYSVKVISVPQCYSISTGSTKSVTLSSTNRDGTADLTVTRSKTGTCAPASTGTPVPTQQQEDFIQGTVYKQGTATDKYSGVTLSISQGTSTTPLAVATTSASGVYRFDDLTANTNYKISITDLGQNEGLKFSSPANGIYATARVGQAYHFTLTADTSSQVTPTMTVTPTSGPACGITCNDSSECANAQNSCNVCVTEGNKKVCKSSTNPSAVNLSLSATLPGISKSTSIGDNNTPAHPSREGHVFVYNTAETVAFNAPVNFTYTNGVFSGKVETTLEPGTYFVKVKFDNTLLKRTKLKELKDGDNAYETVALVPGNMNDNNTLDIDDYNVFISCLDGRETPCTQKVQADYNDDGKVNDYDYNILLRSFASREGD